MAVLVSERHAHAGPLVHHAPGLNYGDRAHLVWVDSLGQSFHSVGIGAGSAMVYDYFGSWSEAPGDCLVRLSDALDALEQFASHGSPATERVMFQPD